MPIAGIYVCVCVCVCACALLQVLEIQLWSDKILPIRGERAKRSKVGSENNSKD